MPGGSNFFFRATRHPIPEQQRIYQSLHIPRFLQALQTFLRIPDQLISYGLRQAFKGFIDLRGQRLGKIGPEIHDGVFSPTRLYLKLTIGFDINA